MENVRKGHKRFFVCKPYRLMALFLNSGLVSLKKEFTKLYSLKR